MSDDNVSGRASRKVGSFLVVMITGVVSRYIAEVVQENPLILKIEESGPYSRLRGEDFVIFEKDSLRAQGDDLTAQALLVEALERGRPLRSGLKKLGVKDGVLHEILPVELPTE